MYKIIVLCTIVAAASASYIGAYGHGPAYGYGATVVNKAYVAPAPVYEPAAPYQMGYDIVDAQGNQHGRRESGDAAGNKAGSYNIALADGRKRLVQYKADGYGFRAVVKSNEPGTDASQDPADVVREPLGYAVNKVVVPAATYGHGVGYAGAHAVGVGYGHSVGLGLHGHGVGHGLHGVGLGLHGHGLYGHGGHSRSYNRQYNAGYGYH